jgi:hypothetical protein
MSKLVDYIKHITTATADEFESIEDELRTLQLKSESDKNSLMAAESLLVSHRKTLRALK